MRLIKIIEMILKLEGFNWAWLARVVNKNEREIKNLVTFNIDKLNNLLRPAGMELSINHMKLPVKNKAIGILKKIISYNGIEPIKEGSPVYEHGDIYYVKSKGTKFRRKVVIRFKKDELANNIDFIEKQESETN